MSGQQMADGGVCARLAAGVVSGWSPNLPTDLAALKLLAPAVAEHLGDRLGGHRAPVRGALGFSLSRALSVIRRLISRSRLVSSTASESSCL